MSRVTSCLAALLFLAVPAPRAGAQTPPEAATLAARAAAKLAGLQSRRILLMPLAGCTLDAQACAQFDQALRDAMAKQGGAQFIEPGQLAGLLKARHFLTIDAYESGVLLAVAPDADVDTLVTEDVTWKGNHYELGVALLSVATGKRRDKSSVRITAGPPGPTGQPILLKDPETGAAFVLWNNERRKAPLFQYPRCNTCPEPAYPVQARIKKLEGAVILQATITENGAAEDLAVVKTFDDGTTASALQAARLWSFHPAMGADGKPFKARITLVVNFRLG